MKIVLHGVITAVFLFVSLGFFLVPENLWWAGVSGLAFTFWYAVFKEPT
jgi:uncharacterized membrane-anchored protein YitT (DUF2179 family)